MSPESIGFALLMLGVLLLVAKLVRVRWKLAQKLYLPSSIIGGGIALILGPDILGRVGTALGTDAFADGLFGPAVFEVWSALPGLLISVVFAGLFLGERMPRFRDAAKLAGPQISFGMTLSAGQYVVGLLLAILVLGPVFGMPPLTGALIEIGFEGGHGTAAGLGNTFQEVGFADGQDLAVGMATVGLLSGIIFGIVLINWGARTGRASQLGAGNKPSVAELMGIVEGEKRRPAGMLTVHPSSIEPLALHFGLLGVAIMIGQAILWGLQAIERALWADTGFTVFEYVPLFPLAMIGGIIVQLVIDRFDKREIVDRGMIERIQGFSLDMLVISAMGTLSLAVIAANLVPFVLLAVAGLVWCIGAFLLLAPRMLPSYWFERGIGDLGQSLGVTATGLVLMRMADPELRTPAYPAFGYKQLVLEPFFGGGLVTAAAVPLVFQFGPYPLLGVMALLLVIALAAGLLYFGRMRPATTDAADAETSG